MSMVAKSREEVLDLPISAITDGWKLKDGQLYLFVTVVPGYTQTIVIPKRQDGT